jgi:hypothetical protein
MKYWKIYKLVGEEKYYAAIKEDILEINMDSLEWIKWTNVWNKKEALYILEYGSPNVW